MGKQSPGITTGTGEDESILLPNPFSPWPGPLGPRICLLPTPSPSLLSAHHTVSPCGFWKDFVLGTILRPMITRHPAPSSPVRCSWFHRETGPSKQALPFPPSRHQKRNLTTAGSWAPATWKDLLPWLRSFVLVLSGPLCLLKGRVGGWGLPLDSL